MDNINAWQPITNRHVRILLSRSERQARRVLKRARTALNKTADEEISIADFCSFKGLHLTWACKELKLTDRKPPKKRE